MNWSLPLGRYFGIGVYVHWTFSLLIIWIVFVQVSGGAGLLTTLLAVAFVCTIFLCVVLHEFGHALTARHFGIRTRDITLLPIGGVARLERMPRNPVHEFWIAVAGPAVNVVIAAVLLLAILLLGDLGALTPNGGGQGGGLTITSAGQFVGMVFGANVILVVFNLIPAFPMDGGRVLRALLATRIDYLDATRVAASIGQLVAIAFALIGLFASFWLLFIAIFVFLGAQAEVAAAQSRSAFRGVSVRRAMVTRFTSLASDATLADASRELLAGTQPDFPVLEGSEVVGVLAQRDLMQALAAGRPEAPVTESMRSDCVQAHPDEMLEGVIERMRQSQCPIALVIDDGRLVGLVTPDNISELLMMKRARARRVSSD